MNPNTTPFDAASIDALLAGHALGDLEETEREQLAGLLRQQPELRRRLEEFSTTLELLPLALPAIAAPPPSLRRRLLQPSPHPGPWRRWLAPSLLAVGLLLLGGELYQTRQQLAGLQRQLSPAAPGERRTLPLHSVQPGQTASGEVLVTGNSTNNLLKLTDLPALPPHHTYRLWATVKGQTVGCVHFVPNARGQVAIPIPLSPTSEATDVRVSVEGDPTGQAPRGPMVLTSSH
ncbi:MULTISPECIES: anti-sigma factor domain-containing protein [unclassified Cyanobium]|uniref:anti-sigma factor domain-containing protein n=1 Tax=unclassified Cyanobium TaxID=2627006 RepID=UPI0020CDBED2|nr:MULTISPECIES: anti-sigma factor [unclassified Cyanobium]MCP9860598.1 anti-sigma factor [Cyanobium sp. Cruz-8H5]MCP9867835.1 anti-sigma factor [Cyanobium sp. Cruz-8D1]